MNMEEDRINVHFWHHLLAKQFSEAGNRTVDDHVEVIFYCWKVFEWVVDGFSIKRSLNMEMNFY